MKQAHPSADLCRGRAGQRVSGGQGRDGAILNEAETDQLITAVWELWVSERGSLAVPPAGALPVLSGHVNAGWARTRSA